MLSAPGTSSKLILLLGAVVSLSACTTLGTKSNAPAAVASTSPTAVDADIQRILTAGGIPADDPVVAALQSPPPVTNGSAWGGGAPAPVATAATVVPVIPAQPTSFPASVQVAAVEGVAGPTGIGVENIGQLDLSFQPVLGASTISSVPLTTTTTAMVPEGTGFIPNAPGLSPAAGSMSSVPASVAAGILPAPNFAQTTMLTGPDAVAPVAAPAAPARPKVVPMPVPRPVDLYTRSQPAAPAVPAPMNVVAPAVAVAPLPSVAPVPLPIPKAVAAPVRRF